MRFPAGSDWEEWLHQRHLFVPAAMVVAILSVLIVLLAHEVTKPEPLCGRQPAAGGECELNVDYGS